MLVERRGQMFRGSDPGVLFTASLFVFPLRRPYIRIGTFYHSSSPGDTTMRTFLFLIVLLLLVNRPAAAQTGVSLFSFGVAASLASPTGDFGNAVGNGVGGAALIKFGLLPVIDLTGSIDYISFAEKDNGGVKTSASTWGFDVGGRISVFPFVFGGLELGSYVLSEKVNGKSLDSQTKSAFAPIIGVRISQLEGSVRYVARSDANFFGARVGLWF